MSRAIVRYVERLHRRLAQIEKPYHTGSRCRGCAELLEGVHLGFGTPPYCSAECRDEWTRALRRRGRERGRAQRQADVFLAGLGGDGPSIEERGCLQLSRTHRSGILPAVQLAEGSRSNPNSKNDP